MPPLEAARGDPCSHPGERGTSPVAKALDKALVLLGKVLRLGDLWRKEEMQFDAAIYA